MRVLFTGNIDNIAYTCAKFARRLGVAADVLISSTESGIAHPYWEDRPDVAEPIMTGFTRRTGILAPLTLLELRRIYRRYNMVVSMGMLSITTMLLRRPYVAVALGADMKELVFEKCLRGWLMDKAFRRASALFYNDVDQVSSVAEKQYEDAHYFPVPIDVARYSPRAVERRHDKLLLIHGSSLSWSLDWTANKELHRRTLKRNDIFFEGLKLYLENNSMPVEVVVPLWGPDKDKVAPLCERLGISASVRLVPKMTKAKLLDMYHRADIVIDQFNMPRLGYNCFEPMACARPVLGYFDPELQRRHYPELPPMLSASTPEEVAVHLGELVDPEIRAQLGERARKWVVDHHHWEPIMRSLIARCEGLLEQSVIHRHS